MKGKVIKIMLLTAPVVLLAVAISVYFALSSSQISDNPPVCLLVQDIEKDNWKSIHYGVAEALNKQNVRLNTYNYSYDISNADEPVNPCPLNSKVIINAWHQDKFEPKGSNARLQVLGNSYIGHVSRPQFSIGSYYAPDEKAKLIVSYIKQQKHKKDVNLVLALGPKDLLATRDLHNAFREELRQYPDIILRDVSYANDSQFRQYLAMTNLLLEKEHIDFVVGTPTAIEQSSKIVDGRDLATADFIALTPSRRILTLLEQNKIRAVVNDKPVLQGRWIANWVLGKVGKPTPDINITTELITAENLTSIVESDMFVPYGYRVIYNTGSY